MPSWGFHPGRGIFIDMGARDGLDDLIGGGFGLKFGGE